MNEEVISPSKQRLFLSLFGALGFVALGVWMVQWPNPVHKFVGILSIGVFGYFFLVGVQRLFTNRFRVVVDANGIHEWQQGYGLIAWQDIEGFDFRNRMMFIKVKNVNKYIERLSSLSKATRWLDGGLNLGLLTLPLWVDSNEMQEKLRLMAPGGSINVIDTRTIDPVGQ